LFCVARSAKQNGGGLETEIQRSPSLCYPCPSWLLVFDDIGLHAVIGRQKTQRQSVPYRAARGPDATDSARRALRSREAAYPRGYDPDRHGSAGEARPYFVQGPGPSFLQLKLLTVMVKLTLLVAPSVLHHLLCRRGLYGGSL
jgi:hypothetical protein